MTTFQTVSEAGSSATYRRPIYGCRETVDGKLLVTDDMSDDEEPWIEADPSAVWSGDELV